VDSIIEPDTGLRATRIRWVQGPQCTTPCEQGVA